MRLRFSVLMSATVLSVCSLAYAAQPKTASSVKSTDDHGKGKSAPRSPTPSETIDIDGLAQLTGIFSYCEEIDPKSSAQYARMSSNVLSGYSQSTIKGDEHTTQYRTNLQALETSLAKIPKATGISSCRTMIPGI